MLKNIKLAFDYHRVKDILLLASVFVTGAAVLIIEIVAMRILSPYYGNTIYTTSSVIGTVLAALSLGYYIGGRLSDKYPRYHFFYGIIFISGLSIFFLRFLYNTILPYFSLLFSITIGSLIFSILIFFLPSFLMGTLSPFAIKLYKKDQGQERIGSQSGEVFFWSTLGSIAGSLLSGFVFIPYFGIDVIVATTGIILSIWGLCGFLLCRPKNLDNKNTGETQWNQNQKILTVVILFFLFEVLFLWFTIPQKQSEVLYEKDGIYEKVKITEGIWNARPARFLFQDKSHSAAMYLDSDELLYNYTKYYELYKLINPKATKAFLIGGGAYSIPKALLKDSPNMQVDVSEIEPELFSLAQKYFNLQENVRLANYTEDGRRFLSRNQKKYDIIVSDVYYSFFSVPIHLTTKEFFELAKSRLGPEGVFIGNFAGELKAQPPSFIFSEIKTFKNIFPNSYFFAVNSAESKNSQNIIFLGINGLKQIDFKSKAILNSNDLITQDLEQKNINISNFDLLKHKELTDDFSPIEYLVSRVVNKRY